MLTSLYYYGYYKPYLYGTDGVPRNKKIGKTQNNENISRFNGIETKDYVHNSSEDFAYFLNYSDKYEVKKMISGISDNVNGIKDTVRYLQNVKFGKNARFDGGQNSYGDGLEDFASDINSLTDFAKGKNVSSDIKDFNSKVTQKLEENSEFFEEVGLSFDGERAVFDRSVYDSLSREEYEDKSRVLNQNFSDIYDDAVKVLSKPMAGHLNFKNLDYYYNYSYSTKSKEPLGFIDSGLVVDITL